MKLCLEPGLTHKRPLWRQGAGLANMVRKRVPLWELQQALLSPVSAKMWSGVPGDTLKLWKKH